MGTAAEHVEAWERAGLIDRETADRLLVAEEATADWAWKETGELSVVGPASVWTDVFGPPVTIAEILGYLGTAFLLGAWSTWVANQASHETDAGWVIGIGASAAALGLGLVGAVLSRGDERSRRAAGVALLVGLASVGTAAFTLIGGTGIPASDLAVIASATTFAFAIACRGFFPALLTQLGLLSALTSLVASALAWIEATLIPGEPLFDTRLARLSGPDPLVLVLGSAAWWLAVAVAIGLLGLAESRSADRDGGAAAGRRAGLTRFWAGMVAVVGLALAVTRSDFLGNGEFGRVLAPWIGDLAVLVVVGVLIERAFRRESSSYVYAAAFGLVIALSDLNVTYVTDGIESALLVEGLILLAAGIAADRLRRRVRDRREPLEPTDHGIGEPPPEPTGGVPEPVNRSVVAPEP